MHYLVRNIAASTLHCLPVDDKADPTMEDIAFMPALCGQEADKDTGWVLVMGNIALHPRCEECGSILAELVTL